MNVEEYMLLYRAVHRLLCPHCEGKSLDELMLENMRGLPFLVKGKCEDCGYEGTLVEVAVNEKKKV